LTRRGFGASSRPATGYQIDSLVRDIRVVLDSLGIARAVLVGHSLAGDELTRFAATWPDRVRRLVYFDAAHDRVPLERMLRELPPPAPTPMTAADSTSPEAFREYYRRNFGIRLTMGEILSIAVFGADGRYLRDVTPPAVDSAILRGLAHPQYAKIKAPALAFYAVSDSAPQIFPTYAAMDSTDQARARRFFDVFAAWAAAERSRFAREVTHGREIELRGAHHYLFISCEDTVLREMSDFLR
jgi:pimeloyl-ACP methyl ester carboxylesterase